MTVATDIENLLTRRSAILTELAAMSTGTAGGLPNLEGGGDMVKVDHVGYRKSLYDELRDIDSLIASIQGPTISEWQGEV